MSQTFQKITKRLSSNQKKFIAEGVGTYIVVVLAAGSVVVDAKTNGILGIPFIAIAPFIGVAIAVYLFGKISMAHFNPAVSIGFLITRYITRIQLLYYFTAEIVGALLACLFIKTEANLGANVPNYVYPLPLIFGIEMLASGLLMAVIFVVVVYQWFEGLQWLGNRRNNRSRHILLRCLYESSPFSGSCSIVRRNSKSVALLDCHIYWNLNCCLILEKGIIH